MISDKELAEMQARCDAATDAPWTSFTNSCLDSPRPSLVWGKPYPSGHMPTLADYQTQGNAQFIAAARTDLPRCIEEIKRLREALVWYGNEQLYLMTKFMTAAPMCEIGKPGPNILVTGNPVQHDKGRRARQALGDQ
jgi:hypothetical protein